MGKSVKFPPLAIAGLALSLFGLGNIFGQSFPTIKIVLYFLASLILVSILLKFILANEVTKKELSSPIVASSFVTFFMAGETFIGGVTLPAPFKQVLWAVFSILFILYYIYFTLSFTRKGDLALVYPSWFVPYVGIATIATVGNALGFKAIAWTIFTIALIAYIILLPIITYKIHHISLTAFEEPTLAIYAAPPSLLLATYLSISDTPNTLITFLLLTVAQLSYLVLLWTLVRLRKNTFSPLFLALTFPSVIAATAIRLVTSKVLVGVTPFIILSQIELLIAVLIVSVLFVKILQFIFK